MAEVSKTLAGLFVGGQSRRMGGRPKGLLPLPGGGSPVGRWLDLLGGMGLTVVLVGAHEAYRDLGWPLLADEPPGIGPIGGLAALLARSPGVALAFACDMPHVERSLVEKLLAAPAAAPIVAPREPAGWQPFFARYDANRVLPVVRRQIEHGQHSLQRLFDECAAAPLELSNGEWALLQDVDTPADLDPVR